MRSQASERASEKSQHNDRLQRRKSVLLFSRLTGSFGICQAAFHFLNVVSPPVKAAILLITCIFISSVQQDSGGSFPADQ
jgi:hypothetical protein